jgi:hypothetical protein
MEHVGRAMIALLALLAACGAGASPSPGSPFPVNGMWHFFARSNDALVCEGHGLMPGSWNGACSYLTSTGPNPPPPLIPDTPFAVVVFTAQSEPWAVQQNGAFSLTLGADKIDCPNPNPATYMPGLYLDAICSGATSLASSLGPGPVSARSWQLYATGD